MYLIFYLWRIPQVIFYMIMFLSLFFVVVKFCTLLYSNKKSSPVKIVFFHMFFSKPNTTSKAKQEDQNLYKTYSTLKLYDIFKLYKTILPLNLFLF